MMSPFHRSSLMPSPTWNSENDTAARYRSTSFARSRMHAVGVAERERGVVGLAAHALLDAVELQEPGLV